MYAHLLLGIPYRDICDALAIWNILGHIEHILCVWYVYVITYGLTLLLLCKVGHAKCFVTAI